MILLSFFLVVQPSPVRSTTCFIYSWTYYFTRGCGNKAIKQHNGLKNSCLKKLCFWERKATSRPGPIMKWYQDCLNSYCIHRIIKSPRLEKTFKKLEKIIKSNCQPSTTPATPEPLNHETVSPSTRFRCLLTTSRDGNSITSLGNLFQCPITITVKFFFLISNLNLPCLNSRPFPLLLSFL